MGWGRWEGDCFFLPGIFRCWVTREPVHLIASEHCKMVGDSKGIFLRAFNFFFVGTFVFNCLFIFPISPWQKQKGRILLLLIHRNFTQDRILIKDEEQSTLYFLHRNKYKMTEEQFKFYEGHVQDRCLLSHDLFSSTCSVCSVCSMCSVCFEVYQWEDCRKHIHGSLDTGRWTKPHE